MSVTQNQICNDTFSAAIVEAKNYNGWIVDFYKQYLKGDILEIGVGHGSFIDYVPSNISSYTGFDIDYALIEYAQNRNPNGKYICGDLSDTSFCTKMNDQKFDAILCINVLEHIPNHVAALQNMLSVLKPNGVILLFIPAFMSLYQDMDHLAGHERRYVIKDIKKLCNLTNSTIKKWNYFNAIGGIGWWINKFKKHSDLNAPNINKQILMFDKYILPFSKMMQPITCKLFGQSLYVVIQNN